MALTDNPMSIIVTGDVTIGARAYLVIIDEDYTDSCDETKYVGVTGGKDYKLNLDARAALIRISYSQSINNTTPSVTDY